MKRVFDALMVSLFLLTGFSSFSNLLEGVTDTPPAPALIVTSTVPASPITPSTPAPTASLITTPTPTPTPIASPTTAPTPTASGMPNTASVNQVITMYYDAIKARNYPQAYTYLDPNATDANGQKITLSSFEQMAQSMESEGGQVVSFSVAVYPPMVVVTVIRPLLGYHVHLQVQQEEQTWKITSLDRV